MTITPERTDTSAVAELRGVDLWYGANHVLQDVSLRVGAGEIVALVGRSGSGKSTLLRVLAGLADGGSGTRSVSGAPAMAFQEPRLFPWRDVATNVGYGLTRQQRSQRLGKALGKAEAAARIERALADVGLTEWAGAWPLTLSGGQAQRVSLARALVGEPELLLLDEPFGALDALTRLSMHALLLRLWRAHEFGVLLVTHDVDEAIALADRVLVLADGQVVHAVSIDEPRQSAGGRSANSERYRTELLGCLGVRA